MTGLVATEPSLTVRTISHFAEKLREACAADHVVIDMAELGEADLSFVQLIEAVRRDARLTNKTIQISAPAGEPLQALLERCGYVASAAPEDLAFWFQGDISQ